MPIDVVGNRNSNDNINKTDMSLFNQKLYLRHNYIESDVEEDIDLINQFRITNLPDSISIREADSENYVDNLFNDPSTVKYTEHFDLNDRNITNARFVKFNQRP